MNNGVKIRGLMLDIEKELGIENTYRVLTQIICSMEYFYNLQEEELIQQLEMILKSVKDKNII